MTKIYEKFIGTLGSMYPLCRYISGIFLPTYTGEIFTVLIKDYLNLQSDKFKDGFENYRISKLSMIWENATRRLHLSQTCIRAFESPRELWSHPLVVILSSTKTFPVDCLVLCIHEKSTLYSSSLKFCLKFVEKMMFLPVQNLQ